MIYPANKKSSLRSCLLPSFLFLIVLPLGLLLLVGLIWNGREASARRRLQTQLDQMLARGEPIDDASLQTFHESQTSDELTDAWLEAIEKLSATDFQNATTDIPVLGAEGPERVPLPDQPWPEEAATRKFLQQWRSLHSEIMRLARQAQVVRFPIKFDSVSTLLPKTQEMRQAARLLALRGQVALRDGDSAELRRAVEALRGVGQATAGEPNLVSQLVTLAAQGMALELLKQGLHYDVFAEADLQALLPQVLTGVNIGPRWKLALRGERAFALPIFENPARLGEAAPYLPGRSRDALQYLELMDRVLQIPTDDIASFRQEVQAVESDIQQLAQAGWLTRFDTVITQRTLPAMVSALDAFARDALQHRLAALAIGLRLHEQQHGQLPESLAPLAELPLDLNSLTAASGEPFGYRLSEQRAELWGYSLRTASSVPAEPPAISAGQPDSAENEIWVWELKRAP